MALFLTKIVKHLRSAMHDVNLTDYNLMKYFILK